MDSSSRRQERTQEAQDIRNIIKAKLSNLKKKYPSREVYVPDDKISVWVTPDAIGRWVDVSNVERIDKAWLKRQICTRALKTFCILLELEKEDCITTFIKSALPEAADSALRGYTIESLRELLDREGSRPISSTWIREKCEDFESRKWKYLAYRFEYGITVEIREEVVLPFRMVEPFETGRDSLLSRVDFDPNYLLKDDGKPYTSDKESIKMVRKTIDLEHGEEERAFLRFMEINREEPHKNIINLFASYTHKGQRYLLMPLLDGDMSRLLNNNEHSNYFENERCYFIQMLHLSEALAALHQIPANELYHVTGVHLDVKPANILLRKGEFVLADFGISKLRCPTSSELEHDGRDFWWRAPETFNDGVFRGSAGPQSDVFSLGCIFIELLVHMYGAAEAVLEFRKRRRDDPDRQAAPFCTEDAKLKAEVVRTIQQFQSAGYTVETIAIATLIGRMLEEDPDERVSAENVVEGIKSALSMANPGSEIEGDEHLDHGRLLNETTCTGQREESNHRTARSAICSTNAGELCPSTSQSSYSQRQKDRKSFTTAMDSGYKYWRKRGEKQTHYWVTAQKHFESALNIWQRNPVLGVAKVVDVHFYLMDIEMNLTRNLNKTLIEREEHLQKAEEYHEQAIEMAQELSDTSSYARLELERVILKAIRIYLRSNVGPGEGKRNKSSKRTAASSETEHAMTKALARLREVNYENYEGAEGRANYWLQHLKECQNPGQRYQ